MRWKIILRIEMHGAETRRGSSARSSKSLRDKAIRPLLERLGLKQTAAESWCSDEVSLEAAAKTLPELMRNISRTKDYTKHFRRVRPFVPLHRTNMICR